MRANSNTGGQREPIVIECEDELIHTNEHPYCNDSTCPCQEDRQNTVEQSYPEAAMTDFLLRRMGRQ